MIDGCRAPAAQMMLPGFRQKFRKLRFQMIDDIADEVHRISALLAVVGSGFLWTLLILRIDPFHG